ncbi:MAG TPA: hypothetical protein VG122_03995 [Gemmata sp.]|nr:hypothetical protein [Gemmata sp.]
MFGRQVQDRLTQFDIETPGFDWKVVLVRFTGRKEANGMWDTRVASSAVSRPVHARNDVKEIGTIVEMPRDTKPAGVYDLFHFNRRGFDFRDRAPRFARI